MGASGSDRGIVYALVARGPVVLCDCSLVQGNSALVALSLLEKWQKNLENLASYVSDRHVFHVLTEDGLTYLCVASEDVSKRVAFAFLADVKDGFSRAHAPAARAAVAYELNTAFEPELRQRMTRFNSDPASADILTRIHGDVSELRDVMVDSIDKILDRGERLDVLVERTDGLASQAFAFKREARTAHRTFYWANVRLRVFVAVGCLLGLYILVALICSPTFHCR